MLITYTYSHTSVFLFVIAQCPGEYQEIVNVLQMGSAPIGILRNTLSSYNMEDNQP